MNITQATANVISALIKELDTDFSATIPLSSSTNIEDLRRLQGQQDVVQYVRNLLTTEEEQED